MNHPARLSLVFASALFVACGAAGPDDPAQDPQDESADSTASVVSDGKGGGVYSEAREAAPIDTIGNTAGIGYGGGPVMLGTPNVYYIWYGNWSGNSATTILPDFASHLGGSPYFNINQTYYDRQNRHVTGNLKYAGSATDNYSAGKTLSQSSIRGIVSSAITSGKLPKDSNGVYLVLTSKDVTEGGFCSQYCGWHTHGTIGSTDIKFAFVGNGERCGTSCGARTKSPNGNPGADAMASVIAHEIEETVSDPDLNAWGDSQGENADKCAWKFGTTYTTANGATANMKLGTRDYLIQQNWVNASPGRCALRYP